MSPNSAFSKMINRIEKNPFPITLKNKVLPKLRFLYGQTVSESIGRAKLEDIRECFQNLELDLQGTGFFDEFQKDKLTWISLASFVGIPSGYEGTDAEFKTYPPAKMDLIDFLKSVFHEVDRTSAIPPLEKQLCLAGLLYLQSEFKRPKAQRRGGDWPLTVWRWIWPTLNRHNLLTRFKTDEDLKKQIRENLIDGSEVLRRRGAYNPYRGEAPTDK